MPSDDSRLSAVRQQLEDGQVEDALESLRSLAEQYAPSYLTAVSMQKAELSALERDALELGEDTSVRERRRRLKRQLFRLLDTVSEKVQQTPGTTAEAAAPPPSPFKHSRGKGPVNIFLMHASADQEGAQELRKSMALLLHLRRAELASQHALPAGDREAALAKALQETEVVLLLLSNEFIADPECLQGQDAAWQLQQQKRLVLIPVLYSPVAHLDQLPIGKLQALPRGGKAITEHPNPDKAYADISRELGELMENIRQQLDYSAASPEQPPGPGGAALNVDHDELLQLFRNGRTESLIQELIALTPSHTAFFERALMLEKQWKNYQEKTRYGTATGEALLVSKNQLDRSLLELLMDMQRQG